MRSHLMTLHMVRKKICVYCPFVICDFVCRHKNYRWTFEFVFMGGGVGGAMSDFAHYVSGNIQIYGYIRLAKWPTLVKIHT